SPCPTRSPSDLPLPRACLSLRPAVADAGRGRPSQRGPAGGRSRRRCYARIWKCFHPRWCDRWCDRRPRMSRPTIKDIAAEAGVALGTASRALSGNGSIAAETRERMLAAAERLALIPNAQARSLRSERTETIGLLIPDVRNPFFAELAHVVEREVRSSGLSVRLCNADEDPDLMRECTFVLTVGASASGCIATTSAPVDEDR